MKMKTESGFKFLDQIVKATGALLLIFFPFGIYYLNFFDSLAVFSGGIWGIINFMSISAIVKLVLSPDNPDKIKALKLGFIKFPMLYIAGYFLLSVPQFDAAYLTIGFSSLFGVLFLRAVGSLLFPSPSVSKNQNSELTA